MDFQTSSIALPYTLKNGRVSCSAPSNIALIKYWGKTGIQIPKNASLSFTLAHCKTETTVSFQKKSVENDQFSIEFLFENAPKPSFEPKIVTFFERIEPYCSFLKDFEFKIESQNTFPHSSGIASSASGMSALAYCLVKIEAQLGGKLSHEEQLNKASFLARLGSGSACRSLEGPITVWGKHKDVKASSDVYAIKPEFTTAPIFENYQDTILLVDKGEKQISSTVGHNLMHDHPFADKRFEQANQNLSKLKEVLINGNLTDFMRIVESEALSLHAMMMTSLPYFILMRPNTLEIINSIWEYRSRTNIPVCFTLDAGANVHVLYPEKHKAAVLEFIQEKLSIYCQQAQYICDSTGLGVKML